MTGGTEAPRAKPNVDIVIDRHYSSKVYTSGSTITGRVTVKPQRDVAFDNFEILLAGVACTRLDYVQQFPAHSSRTFMKLHMPISSASLPSSRVFAAGQNYEIPFNFVVPHQLAMGSCTHKTCSPTVKDQHLRLPPSMGTWEGDDQAPEMAQVEYSVKVRGFKRQGGDIHKVVEGSHLVKVLPALPEDAPLDISPNDERYCMSKSKTIRKNLFSGKAGKVTASAIQPEAIMLGADYNTASATSARVKLEFAGASSDVAPPKINAITGKLTSTTFFGAVPAEGLPNLGSKVTYSSSSSLTYSTCTTVFNVNIDTPTWRPQRPNLDRQDSGYSSANHDDTTPDATAADGQGRRGSAGKKDKKEKESTPAVNYATSLSVPFSIPLSNKKLFLPTFHSCLISRTYALQLSLSVGPTNTTINLSVPIQIGVETIYDPQGPEELPSFESAIAQTEEAEANAYLQPRVLHIPPPEMQYNSILPGYQHRQTIVA